MFGLSCPCWSMVLVFRRDVGLHVQMIRIQSLGNTIYYNSLFECVHQSIILLVYLMLQFNSFLCSSELWKEGIVYIQVGKRIINSLGDYVVIHRLESVDIIEC